MTGWKEISQQQNLELSRELLERQGRVNELTAELAKARADWARLRGVRDLLEQQRDQLYIALRALTDAAFGLNACTSEAARVMAVVNGVIPDTAPDEVGTVPAHLDPAVEEAHAQRLDAQLAAAEARAVADRRVLDAAEALSAAVADFRRDGSVVLVHPDLEPFLAAVDAAVDARRALTGEQTEGAL